jgi:hypothetical protein
MAAGSMAAMGMAVADTVPASSTGIDCSPAQGHEAAGHHAGGPGHHGSTHDCTCPGMCCASGVAALAQGRLVAIPSVPVAVATLAPPPVVVAAPRVILPPPIGPPSFRA